MESAPLATGEAIFELIPQRPPIVMVDTLYRVEEASARAGLTILPTNIFVDNGLLREAGLIEHIAQSSAAFAGYDNWKNGRPPRLGYIAEIKKLKITRLPRVGEKLTTTLSILGIAGSMTLFSAEVCAGVNDVIVSGQMKIFIRE